MASGITFLPHKAPPSSSPLHSLSRLSTVGLTPGSLSLMKGRLPSDPSRAKSTLRAETLPWVRPLSS